MNLLKRQNLNTNWKKKKIETLRNVGQPLNGLTWQYCIAFSSYRERTSLERKYDRRGTRNQGNSAARTNTTATTAGRLVLVACKDTVKLTTRRLLQEQQRERNCHAEVTTSSKEDIVESIRLEDVAMKQEPEDEEDCYLETVEMPALSPSSSTNRHAGAAHRVRSHARSLRAMTNPSAVWAHFDLCANDPLRAQCRICGAVVVRGGANPRQCGTTNLHRHLRVHHGGRLIGSRYHGNSCWLNLSETELITNSRIFKLKYTDIFKIYLKIILYIILCRCLYSIIYGI